MNSDQNGHVFNGKGHPVLEAWSRGCRAASAPPAEMEEPGSSPWLRAEQGIEPNQRKAGADRAALPRLGDTRRAGFNLLLHFPPTVTKASDFRRPFVCLGDTSRRPFPCTEHSRGHAREPGQCSLALGAGTARIALPGCWAPVQQGLPWAAGKISPVSSSAFNLELLGDGSLLKCGISCPFV